MSIVVLLEFRVTAEAVEETKKFFKKILPDTRAYSGCEGLDAYSSEDDPTIFVFYERWQSKEHYQKYAAWRVETGLMGELAKNLVGPPVVRYLDRLDM
jgi:quinol monooxygenase YgiN